MNFFNPFRRFKKQEPSPPHVHSWRAIATNLGELDGSLDAVGQPVRVTEILRLCGCGDYDRTFVQGHWILAQIQAGDFLNDVAELEAESSKLSVDWLFIAELDAVKGYLAQIGLGHVIPVFEEAEYRRLSGAAVLSEPGRVSMPDECLACFAAVGMDSKQKEA
jgi:hypothetical protein